MFERVQPQSCEPGDGPTTRPPRLWHRSPRRLSSLKFHLAALLLPFVALVAIAAAYQGHATVDQAEERRQLGVDFRADLAAGDIDDGITLAKLSIEDVASAPSVIALLDAVDTSGCSLIFQGPPPFSSGHLDILDADGNVLCSSLEEPTSAGYVGADWLGAGLLGSAVSGPVEDAATGERTLVVTTPLDGRGTVAGFLDLDPVGAGLAERLSGPVDTRFALVDPAGEDLAATIDGEEWLSATSPVPSLGWEVRAWSDRSSATADAQALNQRMLAYLLGCIGLLFIALLVVYRGIARPIERLSASVRDVVAGRADKVAAVRSGPAEVVALAGDFAILVENVQTELVQRRQAELAQAEARAQREAGATMLSSIIQSTQSLIYVKDLDGRYLMANASFQRAVQRSEEEIVGQTDLAIYPQFAARWAADDLRARGGLFRTEEIAEGPAGTSYFDTVKFPLYDAHGALYATCGVSLDVTARRQATVVIAEARDAALAANAAKSTFLATMSHEIRTPMTAVIGMTELLANTSLDAHQRELVKTVQSSGDALLAVINNILDISKIESGELQLDLVEVELPTEIELCLDVVRAAAAEKGLELVCTVDDSCPSRIVGDVTRLRQILTNLLANAVKFTDRGEVLVSVSAEEPGGAAPLAIRITVADSGIGIPEESLARLFKSFSQVDASTTRVYGGTGLGLVIARRLAQSMGGDVTVTSTQGKGSTFVVTLLLHRSSEAEPLDVLAKPTAALLSGRSVLVVDDNLTSLRALELQVTRLGMTCVMADSAEAALAIAADGYAYDVALIDRRMPGTDGLELGRALRAVGGPSATAPQIVLAEVGRTPAGIEHVITKPVKTLALRDTLAAALSGHEADGQSAAAGSTPAHLGRHLRILVAEDHRVNQRVVELMLHELGHEVDIVGDGEAAVEAIAEHRYDVVLMDLQMPRMDGLEATRRVRAATTDGPQPHIIAMTASTLVDDRVACAAAGMDSYLSKPVRAADLEAMLQQTTEMAVAGTNAWAEPSGGKPSVQSSSGVPAVDVGVLEDLLRSYRDADGDLRAELIGDYLEEGTTLIRELLAAAEAADPVRLARAAHALRSPSALLGATVLAGMLAAAEADGPRSKQSMGQLARQIAREYSRVASSLRPLTIVEPVDVGRAPS